MSGAAAAEAATPSQARRILSRLGSVQSYIGLALVIIVGIATQGGKFASVQNFTNAIGFFAPRGILAIGMTLVIITAGIDLSVGSLLAVGGTFSAWLLINQNWPVVAIVPVCMLVCALFGLLNGLGTAILRIQAFVMTLAMLSIARGAARSFSHDVSIGTVALDPGGNVLPGSKQFQGLGTPGTQLFGIPLLGYFPVLALIVVTIVLQLVMSKTTFGRHVYAVGGNAQAARLSGVRTRGIVIAVFTISGLLAGLAGPINAAYNASADPEAGTGYELDAIASVVIGGASLAGGTGTVVGTFFGAVLLTLLDNVLGLNNFSADTQLIIKGLIVVLAVVIQRPAWFSDTINLIRRPLARAGAASRPAASGVTAGGSTGTADRNASRRASGDAGRDTDPAERGSRAGPSDGHSGDDNGDNDTATSDAGKGP